MEIRDYSDSVSNRGDQDWGSHCISANETG